MITKPKGTYDLYDKEARIYNYISQITDAIMTSYNYDYIRTPLFEATNLFHRSVGEDSDIVSKETYDFKDRGDRCITLRPEGTAGVVRSLIENKIYGNRNDTIKLYYNGTMYRYERPQAGRTREFTQIGAEAFGSNEVCMDAEMISMGYFILQALGLDNVSVKLNSLGDKESRSNYTNALKSYLEPHLDELCSDCKKRFNTNPLRILDCKVDGDSDILKNAPVIADYLSSSSKNRFSRLKELLTMLDVDFEIDNHIVRGLDYYDEVVWEYKSSNDLALGGGGRYNSLVKNLDGPELPAIGFALGVERIIMELDKILDESLFTKKIDVYVMSVSEEENIYAIDIAQNLRLNGIRVEMNNNKLSMKSQFKIADNLQASYIVMLNNEDLQKGLVTIKDNVTKEDMKIDEKDVIDWLLGNL